MSKANRGIKTLVEANRSLNSVPEEDQNSIFPKIENKKSVNKEAETYNFVNTKRNPIKESTQGFLSNNSKPQNGLIEELMKEIEDQRKEIEQKNNTLMAVQRNFEGLSSMLKREKDLAVENKKKVSTLTEENTKLFEENKVLLKRIEDLFGRIKKYESDVEASGKDKKKMGSLMEDYENLKNKLQDVQQQFDKKKKEVAELEARNKGLSNQIDKIKGSSSGFEEEKQKLINELKKVKEELLNGQTANDKLQKEMIEYKLKQSDFEKLKENYQTLQGQKSDIDKERQDLIKEVSALRNEVLSLQNYNRKLQEGANSQNLQLRLGNEKEETLKDELRNLKKLLEVKTAELLQANSEITSLKKLLEAEKEKNERFSKYKDLIVIYDQMSKNGETVLMNKLEVDQMKQELSLCKEGLDDLAEIRKKLVQLSKDIEKKNKMIDDYCSEKQQENLKNADNIARIKALEEENKRLMSQNQKIQRSFDSKNENDKNKDSQFNSELENLKKKLNSNIAELSDINTKHKKVVVEKEALSRQLENLRGDFEIKLKEGETLRRRLEGMDAEKRKGQFEGEKAMGQLKNELEMLNEQQRTSNLKMEDLKSLTSKKDEEIRRLTAELEICAEGKQSFRTTLVNLETQIKEFKNALEIKESQLDALKTIKSTLTSELAEKTKEAGELANKLKIVDERNKTLIEKNENLNEKYREVNLTLQAKLDELSGTRLRLKQAESSLENVEANYKQILKKLSELDEEKFKEKLTQFEEKEKQFQLAIAKIDHAQSSLLISLSCCECIDSLKSPVTILPCGHNYCEKCLPKHFCKECGGNQTKIEDTFKNKLLGDVVAKVSYNQVILESLKPKSLKQL